MQRGDAGVKGTSPYASLSKDRRYAMENRFRVLFFRILRAFGQYHWRKCTVRRPKHTYKRADR
jgi:hypothetical protein